MMPLNDNEFTQKPPSNRDLKNKRKYLIEAFNIHI